MKHKKESDQADSHYIGTVAAVLRYLLPGSFLSAPFLLLSIVPSRAFSSPHTITVGAKHSKRVNRAQSGPAESHHPAAYVEREKKKKEKKRDSARRDQKRDRPEETEKEEEFGIKTKKEREREEEKRETEGKKVKKKRKGETERRKRKKKRARELYTQSLRSLFLS